MKNKNNIILFAITLIVVLIIGTCLYFSNYKKEELPEEKYQKTALSTIVKLANNVETKQINNKNTSPIDLKTDILNDEDVNILKNITSNKNIIFLIDMSGSMEENLEDVKSAFINISAYISEDANVTLIAFNKNVYIHMLNQKFTADNKAIFMNAINDLTVDNSCCTYNALSYALGQAINTENTENTEIILLSDGQISIGYTYDDLRNVIPYLNIPIHTISYGSDAEFSILEEISNNTNGINIKATNENIFEKLKEIIKKF